jgi:TonB family protein
MLDTLIESRSHKRRNTSGTIVAATAHGLVIIAAAYATATASPSKPDAPTDHLRWVQPITPRATRASDATPSKPRNATASMPAIPRVSVDIPSNLPSVNIPLRAISSDREVFATVGSRSDQGETNMGPALNGRQAYDATEVESQVAIETGMRPEYPASLRSSGVEGRVTVEFVVDETGKASPSSLRILSSTNELFAQSVRRAVMQSRFKPASIAGKPVAQLVQQLFVFKLDR